MDGKNGGKMATCAGCHTLRVCAHWLGNNNPICEDCYKAAESKNKRWKVCGWCGKTWLGPNTSKYGVYCPACTQQIGEGKRTQKPMLSIETISKLAAEAGMSYGVYCCKHGL